MYDREYSKREGLYEREETGVISLYAEETPSDTTKTKHKSIVQHEGIVL